MKRKKDCTLILLMIGFVLTGDRHQAVYAPDGRLIISFRDNAPGLSRFRQFRERVIKALNHQETGRAVAKHGLDNRRKRLERFYKRLTILNETI